MGCLFASDPEDSDPLLHRNLLHRNRLYRRVTPAPTAGTKSRTTALKIEEPVYGVAEGG
jgi:hypothetical protein